MPPKYIEIRLIPHPILWLIRNQRHKPVEGRPAKNVGVNVASLFLLRVCVGRGIFFGWNFWGLGGYQCVETDGGARKTHQGGGKLPRKIRERRNTGRKDKTQIIIKKQRKHARNKQNTYNVKF